MTEAVYALIGTAGYIAPRHLNAMKETGGVLKAALDPSDSVGVIDSYYPDARFFTEFERFDRYVDLCRRKSEPIDYVSICSPNYLHDAHVRFALRSGAHAICEKPLVLNTRNIDGLEELEQATGKNVFTILQLRLHPAIQALKAEVEAEPTGKIHDVDLTYITSRGRWYYTSWKGRDTKSGRIATNIGVHFFDMLSHIFGPLKSNTVHHRAMDCASGYLEYQRARVRWFLSINVRDVPEAAAGKKRTYRSITVDGKELEFSEGFTDLHTVSYRGILSGQGFRAADVRPCIEAVEAIRSMPISPDRSSAHPFLSRATATETRYVNGWPA